MDMAKVGGPLSVVNVHKFEHLGCPLIIPWKLPFIVDLPIKNSDFP